MISIKYFISSKNLKLKPLYFISIRKLIYYVVVAMIKRVNKRLYYNLYLCTVYTNM